MSHEKQQHADTPLYAGRPERGSSLSTTAAATSAACLTAPRCRRFGALPSAAFAVSAHSIPTDSECWGLQNAD